MESSASSPSLSARNLKALWKEIISYLSLTYAALVVKPQAVAKVEKLPVIHTYFVMDCLSKSIKEEAQHADVIYNTLRTCKANFTLPMNILTNIELIVERIRERRKAKAMSSQP
ncbi:hypothetical protein NL676_008935 [Syzygium grande]|nr:hypothetical protein NL676_008935 [Syzygium grande]